MEVLLVTVVAAAIIYKIGREVLGSFRHPDDEDLLEYWQGITREEDRSAYRQISEHLASCDRCRDRLDELRKRPGGPGAHSPMITRRY
ncbi:hypothetical protein GGR26_000233 [Lewinella marina]|uniref:Zinc-finger domain-containing protein n=1 Tax=Neolewinella marina TaxID=438751 RepID=A0A2G0CK64_9BACT|nr:hypothetical protein [Neolewinella marina]NJB84488.1 hypothetical protein [Neolewinella marina]PHL00321.1 hypothetical protein CGL56_04620 [Neolewinella marina]